MKLGDTIDARIICKQCVQSGGVLPIPSSAAFLFPLTLATAEIALWKRLHDQMLLKNTLLQENKSLPEEKIIEVQKVNNIKKSNKNRQIGDKEPCTAYTTATDKNKEPKKS